MQIEQGAAKWDERIAAATRGERSPQPKQQREGSNKRGRGGVDQETRNRRVSRRAAPGKRKLTEWFCAACETGNFLQNTECRRCGAEKTDRCTIIKGYQDMQHGGRSAERERAAPYAPAPAPQQRRSPSNSRPAASYAPMTPGNQRQQQPLIKTQTPLQKAKFTLSLAKAADMPPEIIGEMEAHIEDLEQQERDLKPLGQRIDMAQAALRRADLAYAKKQEALEQAKAELEKAEADWHAANDELEHVRTEAETFAAPEVVEQDDPQVAARTAAEALLVAVEQTWPTQSGAPPEHLLGVMNTARRALEVAKSPSRSRVSAAPDVEMPEAKAAPKLQATPKIQARPLPVRKQEEQVEKVDDDEAPLAAPSKPTPQLPTAAATAASSTAGAAEPSATVASPEAAAAEAAAEKAAAQQKLWLELVACDNAESYGAIVKQHMPVSAPY